MPLAKTAKIDLEQLRRGGYSPTDEEVIQLNDLAIRIEKGKDTTPANAPRIAFAGNVVLHEPTIGMIEWWENYGRDADLDEEQRILTYFFAMSKARNLDVLDELHSTKEILKAVKKWKKSVQATQKELWRALLWCKFGTEQPDEKETIPEVDTSEESEARLNVVWNLICQVSSSCHLTYEQLRTHTQTQLLNLLECSWRSQGIPMKRSVADDYMAYQMIIRTIEDRGKDNG